MPRNKLSVMVARPFGLSQEVAQVGDFLFDLGQQLASHPRVNRVIRSRQHSSRILMNRNTFAQEALEQGCDLLLMVDPDMHPLAYNGRDGFAGFFESSLACIDQSPFSVVGAPASGDPPPRRINVFPLHGEDEPMRNITHEEAQRELSDPSFQLVSAIGTGLMLIHVPIFRWIDQPYFDDLYVDEAKTKLYISQDIYFTRNCTHAGVNVFANWYAFSGHMKLVSLGCPGDEPKHEYDAKDAYDAAPAADVAGVRSATLAEHTAQVGGNNAPQH